MPQCGLTIASPGFLAAANSSMGDKFRSTLCLAMRWSMGVSPCVKKVKQLMPPASVSFSRSWTGGASCCWSPASAHVPPLTAPALLHRMIACLNTNFMRLLIAECSILSQFPPRCKHKVPCKVGQNSQKFERYLPRLVHENEIESSRYFHQLRGCTACHCTAEWQT